MFTQQHSAVIACRTPRKVVLPTLLAYLVVSLGVPVAPLSIFAPAQSARAATIESNGGGCPADPLQAKVDFSDAVNSSTTLHVGDSQTVAAGTFFPLATGNTAITDATLPIADHQLGVRRQNGLLEFFARNANVLDTSRLQGVITLKGGTFTSSSPNPVTITGVNTGLEPQDGDFIRIMSPTTAEFSIYWSQPGDGFTLSTSASPQCTPAPTPACSNGRDDDGDGLIDSADPGCHTDGNAANPGSYNPQDTDEYNAPPAPACSDGRDNDGDGLVDSADPGCHTDGNAANPASYNPQDTDEYNAPVTHPACSDGVDNDGDGLIDSADPGCHTDGNPYNAASYNPQDTDESNALPAPACSDGRDNDGDGLVDYPADPGCSSAQDTDEYNAPAPAPACSDGRDNDGDGLVDSADPGCHTDGNAGNSASYNPQDTDESNVVSGQTGCIDLVKETYDTNGAIFTPVPQFTFHLDGQATKMNDGSGRVRFDNVTPGLHLVTEDVPAGWTQLAVTPQGGTVNVFPGSTCAAVSIKNRQALPGTPPLSTFDPNGGSHVTLPPPTRNFEDEVRVSAGAYPVFPDVDSSTDEGQAANLLQRRGIVGGFPDGTFRPAKGVNRAEAAKFLLLASGIPVPSVPNDGYFWDVLDGEWYVKYVVEASLRGIIIGYPDGSFGPQKPVNTAEFLKMLTLTFNLPLNLPQSYSDVPAGAWFAPYAGIAQQYGLFPQRATGILDPSRPLTRAETALAIARILTATNR